MSTNYLQAYIFTEYICFIELRTDKSQLEPDMSGLLNKFILRNGFCYILLILTQKLSEMTALFILHLSQFN